ncbi:DUF1801 domain-containing protein [Marinicella sp. W31]|uniref:DUF1801 domain-containing protein n=1 Tax=Marinicella sp. W31 TaxID=3023713 RepID=UPI0037564F04
MSENKTQKNAASVQAFLETVEHKQKLEDSQQLLHMMQAVSGEEPAMWGPSIIGFGEYHYKYDSGREGDFMRIGFSPRKSNISIYIIPGFSPYQDLMDKLGKHKLGKSCLYINKLADVDQDVLKELMARSLDDMKKKYGP